MKKQIRNVRLYGEVWAPEFFALMGWRGRWVRVLNWCRWQLELRVNWHAMVLIANATGQDLSQAHETFEKDAFVPFEEFKDDFNFASPLALRNSAGEMPPHVRTTAEETNSVLARLMAPPRSRRYAGSRHRHRVYELDPTDITVTVGGQEIPGMMGDTDAEDTTRNNDGR